MQLVAERGIPAEFREDPEMVELLLADPESLDFIVFLEKDGQRLPIPQINLTPVQNAGGTSVRFELRLDRVTGFFKKLFGSGEELLVRVKMYVRAAPGQQENSTKEWYHSKDGGRSWQHYTKDPKWSTERIHNIEIP